MATVLESISKQLAEYYRDRTEKFETSSQQVGWKSRDAQERRFDQLLKTIVEPSGFSLNDFGCGQGDLVRYAATRGYVDYDYTGYDLFPTMIETARDAHGENALRKFVTLDQPDQMKIADYTLASGVLNLRFDISDKDWLNYVEGMILLFDARSRKGFAFNALTSYSDPELMRPELYYADPCKLFDFCKRNVSKNVALLHDYQEYDFTIIVRK